MPLPEDGTGGGAGRENGGEKASKTERERERASERTARETERDGGGLFRCQWINRTDARTLVLLLAQWEASERNCPGACDLSRARREGHLPVRFVLDMDRGP